VAAENDGSGESREERRLGDGGSQPDRGAGAEPGTTGPLPDWADPEPWNVGRPGYVSMDEYDRDGGRSIDRRSSPDSGTLSKEALKGAAA
jgi:hypothetical protein